MWFVSWFEGKAVCFLLIRNTHFVVDQYNFKLIPPLLHFAGIEDLSAYYTKF